ncbi:hypothetical protein BH09ACT8_BH09ACT8_21380 [soil metagenome]
MAEFTAREQEALESYRRYAEQRERCVAGRDPWSAVGRWFTDDAVFIDPPWGRVQGRDEITGFLDHSMAGFEGWSFPEEWTMVDGDRDVTLLVEPPPRGSRDGSAYQAPAFSLPHHAGDGLFDYELDVLNIAQVGNLVAGSDPGINTYRDLPLLAGWPAPQFGLGRRA